VKNYSVSKYFDDPPAQWGLRGDPYLWQEMKTKMETYIVPKTAKELKDLLHTQSEQLTGEKIKRGKSISVSRYDLGGMSGGVVSCDVWLDVGFPIAIKRYKELSNI